MACQGFGSLLVRLFHQRIVLSAVGGDGCAYEARSVEWWVQPATRLVDALLDELSALPHSSGTDQHPAVTG
jgi:hypothetical protein